MTDLEPGDGPDPVDEPGTGRSDGATRPARRPNHRRDPAAMRETLDAARRRLGASAPTDEPPQSAAHQRALLREAVANQSKPLGAGSVPPDPDPPTAPTADPAGSETDAGGTATDPDPDARD